MRIIFGFVLLILDTFSFAFEGIGANVSPLFPLVNDKVVLGRASNDFFDIASSERVNSKVAQVNTRINAPLIITRNTHYALEQRYKKLEMAFSQQNRCFENLGEEIVKAELTEHN